MIYGVYAETVTGERVLVANYVTRSRLKTIINEAEEDPEYIRVWAVEVPRQCTT